MFKKLIAVVVLCLSVSFSYADPEIEALIDNIQIDKTINNITYMDDDHVVNVAVYQFKDSCLADGTCLYNALVSKKGKNRQAHNTIKCPQCTINQTFSINIILHAPQETLLVILEKDSNGASLIELFNISKDLRSSSIKFITSKNISSDDIKSFLLSPVAQRAFKKAGFSLTKEQIDSMIEVTPPPQSINYSMDK